MAEHALPISSGVAHRLAGRPFLVALDVDGTLAPIAPRPEYAVVPPETRAVVEQLVALPHVFVAVLSGRGALNAEAVVGVRGTWTIGNHGVEVAAPGEPPVVRPDVITFADRVATAVGRTRDLASHWPGVLVEDKRWTASVHYRLAHPSIVPEIVQRVSEISSSLGLRVTQGKEVLELRPPVHVDKGVAAVELAQRLGALHSGASIFCAGDDRTDEDAFQALRDACPNAVTVRVGDETTANETAAEFCVSDPVELRALLEGIVAQRTNGTAR